MWSSSKILITAFIVLALLYIMRWISYRAAQDVYSKSVDFDQEAIFYLRVHKTDSSTTQSLLSKVSAENTGNAAVEYLPCGYQGRCLNTTELQRDQFGKVFSSFERPHVGFGHVNFVPMNEIGFKSPIWVSQIRDPISRFASAHDFARTSETPNYNSRSLYENLQRRNSPRVANLTYRQWFKMDLNWCLENDHADCTLVDNEWSEAGLGFSQVVSSIKQEKRCLTLCLRLQSPVVCSQCLKVSIRITIVTKL